MHSRTIMRKRVLFVLVSIIALFVTCELIGTHSQAVAQPATMGGQSTTLAPVDFYRFIVNNTELGTLLTTNYQEGVNLNFAYYPFPEVAKIAIPPAPGWTPTPGQGLIPLYRYRITQHGRIYYGYFNGLASGSGYTFQGVAGYVFPGDGSFGGIPLQAYYSQTRGYFYTVGSEVPIGYPYYNGFLYHGAPCYLPQGGQFSWDPPPVCDPDGSQQQQCFDSGGNWNQSTCSCNYFNPCGTATTGPDRPIEPCLVNKPSTPITRKKDD